MRLEPGRYEELLEARTAELRASEERLRTIVRENADGIVVVSAEGRVVFANPAACGLFGRSEDELKALDMGLPVVDGESSEVQIRRPDGTAATAEMRAVPLVWDGAAAYLATLRDVTERKQLEERLREAHRLETVGLLAGGVAHDFNNQLTVIIGLTQMLIERDRAEGRDTAEAGEIMKAAVKSAELTRQLLAFSRRQILRPQLLDLNAVVREAAPMLERLAGPEIQMRVKLDPKECRVNADRGQIEQVLTSLVENSRDAMPGGGRISIRTSVSAECGGEGRPGHVKLTVADTGQGMSPQILRRVFEPFFTTKEPGHGSGMALAAVYGIVKQSGGDIEAESAAGKGAKFHIHLPCAGPREAEQKRQAGKLAVLVAVSDVGVRKMIRLMLQQIGHEVTEAEEAPEGVRLVRERETAVDLLITDPGAEGDEMVNEARRGRGGAKVLYLSGPFDDAVAARGGAGFLQKPFTRDELDRKVREVMEESS